MKKILFIALLAVLIGFDSLVLAPELGDQRLQELFQTEVVHPGKTIEWNSGMFVVYRRAPLTSAVNWIKSGSENSLYITPGIIWKIQRGLEVGLGVPMEVSHEAARFRTIVKPVYEFGGSRDQRNESLLINADLLGGGITG